MFKIYFGIFVLFTLGCNFGQSCRVQVKFPYPLFSKKFGSKNITFRPKETGIYLKKGEAIEVYCGSGIKFNTNYYNSPPNGIHQTAWISCNQDDRILLKANNDAYGETVTAYCESPAGSSLYESQKKLPNCDKFMNYVIGEQIPFLGTFIKSALCYDIESFTLKYVSYIAYQKNDIWISHETPSNELAVDLDQKVDNLDNYFEFMSQNAFNASRDTMQSMPNQFFKDFEFDLDSILQDDHVDNERKDFGYIFNTMWWRILRQNNWRFFLDALKERTKSKKYLVYLGHYGNATMPVRESAGDVLVDLNVHSSNLVVTAPTYIWAYLKSLTPGGNAEEFVVIAHNSPYVVAPNHTDFCTNDICDDITWLKASKFGHLRRIPTFGYIFCCRAEEVAKKIDYFPMIKKSLETTTGPTIKSTTSANFIDYD